MQYQPEKRNSLPSYAAAQEAVQQNPSYPPATLVAPLPEPVKQGAGRLAHGFGIAALVLAEVVLVNCLIPNQSLVVATNPFTSLDVFAVGLYTKDNMWNDYDIAPSDTVLKIIASLHIVSAIFTALVIVAAVVVKLRPTSIGTPTAKIWTLLIFVPFIPALLLAFCAFVADWAVLQRAISAGQQPEMAITFAGGNISEIIPIVSFALACAGFCLAFDLRCDNLKASKKACADLPMPFKIHPEQP